MKEQILYSDENNANTKEFSQRTTYTYVPLATAARPIRKMLFSNQEIYITGDIRITIEDFTNQDINDLRKLLEGINYTLAHGIPSDRMNLTLNLASAFDDQGLEDLDALFDELGESNDDDDDDDELRLWPRMSSIHLNAKKLQKPISAESLIYFTTRFICAASYDWHSYFQLTFIGFTIADSVIESLQDCFTKEHPDIVSVFFVECQLNAGKMFAWYKALCKYSKDLHSDDLSKEYGFTSIFINGCQCNYVYDSSSNTLYYSLDNANEGAIAHINDWIQKDKFPFNTSFKSSDFSTGLKLNNTDLSSLKPLEALETSLKLLDKNSAKLPDIIRFGGEKTNPVILEQVLKLFLENSNSKHFILDYAEDGLLKMLMLHFKNHELLPMFNFEFKNNKFSDECLLDFLKELGDLKLTNSLAICFRMNLSDILLKQYLLHHQKYSQHLQLIFEADDIDKTINEVFIKDLYFLENLADNASLAFNPDWVILRKSPSGKLPQLLLPHQYAPDLFKNLNKMFKKYPESTMSRAIGIYQEVNSQILDALISLLPDLDSNKSLRLQIAYEEMLNGGNSFEKKLVEFFAIIPDCKGHFCLDLTGKRYYNVHSGDIRIFLDQLATALRSQARFTVIFPRDRRFDHVCQVLSMRNKLLSTYPELTDFINLIFYTTFPEIYKGEKLQPISLRLHCLSAIIKYKILLKSDNSPAELLQLAKSLHNVGIQAVSDYLPKGYAKKLAPKVNKFFSLPAKQQKAENKIESDQLNSSKLN